jgi:hypothetical protein
LTSTLRARRRPCEAASLRPEWSNLELNETLRIGAAKDAMSVLRLTAKNLHDRLVESASGPNSTPHCDLARD